MSSSLKEELKLETVAELQPKIAEDDFENGEYGEYEDLSEEDMKNGQESNHEDNIQSWGFTQKELSIPSNLNGLRTEIEQKAKELNLTLYFNDTKSKKILFMGEGYALNEMATYLNNLSMLMDKPILPKVALGEYIQKEIPLTSSFKHFKPLIDKVAENLELVFEYDSTKMIVHGFERRVKELMAFLFEKENEYGQGQYVDREINISTFHREFQKEIGQKATALGLKFDFGYDIISVRGPRKLVDQLILYLMALETKAKKALFPKYWDFTDNNPLSLITIKEDIEEYKMVSTPFLKTMSNTKILSIHRIQNKYLMDQFVAVIHKKIEKRPPEQIKRMLLFHGTKTNLPEKIYGNFDTGFDLQYAGYGMYGKGIYFAMNSNYSNGYAFNTKTGTKQMFLADVFVGNSFQGGNSTLVKAPPGYDSVYASGSGHYIIYHNFYSYPLYLIEYK